MAKEVITVGMKKDRYAFEVKATYTYRIFKNAHGDISIAVQKTKDFKRFSLNDEICTMTVETFDKLSLSDINWIVDFLRVNARYECNVFTCYVDDSGEFYACTDIGFGTEETMKQFVLTGESISEKPRLRT